MTTRVPLHEPHHDGSELHVGPGPIALGHRVAVRLQVPSHDAVDRVAVRITPDAEPAYVEARVDRVETHRTWWVAEIPIVNPVTSYRFALERETADGVAVRWLNAAGVHDHDVPDAGDFRLTTHRPPPAWLRGATGYQIFPDRFARSGAASTPPTETAPPWARPAAWDDPPEPRGRDAVRQFYGGDLTGVIDHLDHLTDLGVDVVYLTPLFPARSSHRYDATTFDHVDPLLGGDDAFARLCTEAHRRGLRVIADLTTNHTGDHHDWFERARADATSTEAGFYTFHRHPDRYAAWYDVPTLPELDLRSAALRRRLIEGHDSVVARWMAPPWSIDGWRIDCANTTGRRGAVDVNHDVARTIRATMLDEHEDPWLLAEHCYDASDDLTVGGWHGVMAYQWFTRPLAQWLATAHPIATMSPRPLGRLDGAALVASMRALSSGVPWSAIEASMTLLDSHDTPRFRSLVADDVERHRTALVALFTFPGVPTVFAGSEVGVSGPSMDTARVPFPWDRGRWDHETLDLVRTLIRVRHDRPALATGGLRWLPARPDRVRWVRESADGDTLVVELRRPGGRHADPRHVGDRTSGPIENLGAVVVRTRDAVVVDASV